MKTENNFEQRVQEKYPNLQYNQFRVLETPGERLAIDDLSWRNPACQAAFREIMELFVLACKGFVDIQDPAKLACSTNSMLDEVLAQLDPTRTLLLFPGAGSQTVKPFLPQTVLNDFPSFDLGTIRRLRSDMSVQEVVVTTPKNELRKKLPPRLESCVVIDDVVASGATNQAIRTYLDERNDFNWYSVSWMMLSPLQSRLKKEDELQSGLFGYRKVAASLVYQGTSGIPANNSLSSFAEYGEKSEAVIAGYKRKYVEDQAVFDEAVAELRRLKNETD